jgi:hypothetical protein
VQVSLWENDAHARQMDNLKEMVVNARHDAEAVGVRFTPIVHYPVAWHIELPGGHRVAAAGD